MADPASSAGPSAGGVLIVPIELDFAPDSPNFTRARDDETLYWSNSYKELSHPKLFVRAAKTRGRLIPDLKQTLIKLSTSKKRRLLNGGKLFYDLEPPESRYELRLTGHADAGITRRILMTGCVWIQCSDKYSVWKIKKRLAELAWLQSNAWAPVHVYLEPIIAANSTSRSEDTVYDYRAGTSLGFGFQLHLDIARTGDGGPLCGRPCRSRITLQSKVVNESFCRVGGVLRINDSVDALITTAHGILNYFIVEYLPLLEEINVAENRSDSDDESSDEGDMEDYFSSEPRSGVDPDHSHTEKLGYTDTSQVQWESVKPFDTITYIFQAMRTDTDSMWDLMFRSFEADYALLKQRERRHPSRTVSPDNLYTIDLRHSTPESRRSPSPENHEGASPVESKTSYILLGPQEVVPVQLFLEEVEISLGGIKFKTLKLQAPKVLAEGTSGSWVVRGDKLCGVIIAIYQLEPYALVLPATTVCRNLMEFGGNIKEVSLPQTDPVTLTSDVDGARLRTTTISRFEPFGILPPVASSFAQSTPAAAIPHGSASQVTTKPSREEREPQTARPRPRPRPPPPPPPSSINPRPPTPTPRPLYLTPGANPRPPTPPRETYVPAYRPSSIRVPAYAAMSAMSGSYDAGGTEANPLREARLNSFTLDSDGGVMGRLLTGRTRDITVVRAFLNHFDSQFYGNRSSSSSSSSSNEFSRSSSG